MTEPKKRKLTGLLIFPLGHFAVDLPGAGLYLLAPSIGIAWGLTPSQIGLIITANMVGAALGYLPAGLLGDRIRARRVLLVVTLFWVVLGYSVASVSTNYWILLLLLGFAAIGDAAWHPIALATMVIQMPQQRALAMGVHHIGGIIADVVAPLLVGFMLAYFQWDFLLRILVGPAFLLGFLLLCLKRPIPRSTEPIITRDDLRSLLRTWRRWNGLGMLGMISVYNISAVALLAMIPLYLLDYHGYSMPEVGLIFACMLLAGAVSAPVLGNLSDRIGRKQLTIVSMLIATLFAAVGAFVASPALIIIAAIVSAAMLIGAQSVFLAAAIEMLETRASSTVLGFIYMIMNGIGAFGGLFAGLAGDIDLRYALVFVALTAALAAIIAIVHPFQNAASVPTAQAVGVEQTR